LFDESGDIRDRLGFIGQPETLFYDADEKVASTWVGPLPEDEPQRGLDLITDRADAADATPNVSAPRGGANPLVFDSSKGAWDNYAVARDGTELARLTDDPAENRDLPGEQRPVASS
jgi:hypothetical protein